MFVDPYLATVTIFGGTFAPMSWMLCQGQLISIAENTALFSLLGTTYGGDGQTTFALPDLRGRMAIHPGTNSFGTYDLGEMAGTESVTLLSINMPPHSHAVISTSGAPGSFSDAGGQDTPGAGAPAGIATRYSATKDSAMAPTVTLTPTGTAGGNLPVDMRSPYLAMNYIICTEGIYPSRN